MAVVSVIAAIGLLSLIGSEVLTLAVMLIALLWGFFKIIQGDESCGN